MATSLLDNVSSATESADFTVGYKSLLIGEASDWGSGLLIKIKHPNTGNYVLMDDGTKTANFVVVLDNLPYGTQGRVETTGSPSAAYVDYISQA